MIIHTPREPVSGFMVDVMDYLSQALDFTYNITLLGDGHTGSAGVYGTVTINETTGEVNATGLIGLVYNCVRKKVLAILFIFLYIYLIESRSGHRFIGHFHRTTKGDRLLEALARLRLDSDGAKPGGHTIEYLELFQPFFRGRMDARSHRPRPGNPLRSHHDCPHGTTVLRHPIRRSRSSRRFASTTSLRLAVVSLQHGLGMGSGRRQPARANHPRRLLRLHARRHVDVHGQFGGVSHRRSDGHSRSERRQARLADEHSLRHGASDGR